MKLTDIIFTEKYRPQTLEELVLESRYKHFLQQALKEPNKMPHFLFNSFTPGTGKTSVAYLICNSLGSDKLILNASSERGIDVVREQVNNFTKTKSLKVGIKKAVILDEADGLTSMAQNSLRNLMEETVNNAFFILTANHIEKIIEPIISRCITINFNSPPKPQIKIYLNQIIEKEQINISKIDTIIDKYYPDIRKMVLHLQSIKQGIPIESLDSNIKFKKLFDAIKESNFDIVKQQILSEEINVEEFIDFLFINISKVSSNFTKLGKLCRILAIMEKYINFNVNPKIIFLGYVEEIQKCLITNY